MKKLFTLALMCMMMFVGFAQDPGTLDESFGDNGVSVINPCDNIDGWPYIFEQSDGKILLVGKSRLDGANYSISVARLNADGTLDETYGSDNGYSFFRAENVYLNEPSDAVLGDNGQLYVLGHVFAEGVINKGYILCVDENGMANSSFGEGGYAMCDRNNTVFDAITMDDNGNVYVAGWTFTGVYDNAIIQRYLPNGTLDASWGNNGNVLIVGDKCSSYIEDLLVVEDDKLLIGGYEYVNVNMTQYMKARLWKYDNNGTVDTSFGNDGKVEVPSTDLSNIVLDLDKQSNGKYIVSGIDELPHTQNLPRNDTYVACVNQDGSIDTSFGTDGYVYYELLSGEGRATLLGQITVAHDDQIFGSFYVYNYETPEPNRSYVFNLNPDGTENEDFAGVGMLPLPWDGYFEVQALTVAMQRDGKLLVAGYADGGGASLDIKMIASRVNTSVTPYQNDDNEGVAEVDVEVEVLSSTSVKLTFTPNEYTTEYFFGVLPKDQYEQYGEEFCVDYIYDYAMPTEGAIEGTMDVEADTDYIVMAFGYNAKGERGTVTAKDFSTVGCIELNDIQFTVYPNPATSMIYVEMENDKDTQVSILDVTGRCVKSVQLTENVSSINIEDVENGVYFIMIQQGENSSVRKLVVK